MTMQRYGDLAYFLLTQQSNDEVRRLTRQLQHYKTLLVRAQSASSASIQDLHMQVVDMERRYKAIFNEHAQCAPKSKEVVSIDLNSLETQIRGMTSTDRIRLLGVVAEGRSSMVDIS